MDEPHEVVAFVGFHAATAIHVSSKGGSARSRNVSSASAYRRVLWKAALCRPERNVRAHEKVHLYLSPLQQSFVPLVILKWRALLGSGVRCTFSAMPQPVCPRSIYAKRSQRISAAYLMLLTEKKLIVYWPRPLKYTRNIPDACLAGWRKAYPKGNGVRKLMGSLRQTCHTSGFIGRPVTSYNAQVIWRSV